MKTLARFLIAACALCVASLAQAQFQNGGFEQGDLSGWTIGGGSNPGLAGTPPFTAASIQISGSAPGPATVVGEITDANAPEIVIFGGAQIYAEAEPLARRVVLTEIARDYDADAWAPTFGADWHETARESHVAANGLPFSFVTLERR